MKPSKDLFLKVIFWVGIASIVSAVVFSIFAIRYGQAQTTPKVDYTQEAARRILDCTDTDGACAIQNREATAKLIQQLIDANAANSAKAASAAAFCADKGITTYPSLLACTLENMNKDK